MNTSKNDNAEIANKETVIDTVSTVSYEHLPQICRELRGHDFYPTIPIPALYETEDVDADNKVIHAKYFHPAGTWLVAEIEVSTGLAFGYAKLASNPEGAEWGYFSLPELEQIATHGGFVVIERDNYFTSTPFGEMGME